MRVGDQIIAEGIALLLERRFHVDDGQTGLAQQLHKTFVYPAFAGLMIPGPKRARGNDQNHGIIVGGEFDQFIAAARQDPIVMHVLRRQPIDAQMHGGSRGRLGGSAVFR